MNENRIGRQDPTVAYILPYTVTDGQLAIDLYEMSGREVLPWQQALLFDLLAMNDDGKYIHIKFGYSIPRRNGKGEVIIMRELYGLAKGERIMHTAHLTSTSHSAWERLCNILDDIGIEYKAIRAKGQEYIDLENGGHIEFRTRTSKGGLGEGYDLLVIDEAQEYKTDQDSSLKYMITSSSNPQMIMCGTPPTPISSGTVFKDFRRDVLSCRTEDCGWAEWSVEFLSDIHDRELWYETNPSLGLTLTERDIAAELTGADKVDFNVQRLGFWIRYNLQSAILESDWLPLKVDRLPVLTGQMYIGIKYNNNGLSVSMAMAVKTADGRIFTEVIGNRPMREGNQWIMEFLQAAGRNVNKVIIDGNGQKILEDEMKKVKLKNAILPKVESIKTANAFFEKSIFEKKLCRMEQPSLTKVATNCEKRPIGTNGGFGYREIKEGYDISILDCVILAVWAAESFRDHQAPKMYG